jgi:RNA polymerase primary sigma factor
MVDEELLAKIEGREYSAISRLVALGRRKPYVTLDDILAYFPEVERDVGQLEEAFAALFSAGIHYLDEKSRLALSEDELPAEAKEPLKSSEENDPLNDNDLANINIYDGIGLYIKEVGWIPLLTPEEEVELAHRIEDGRRAQEELASGNVGPSTLQDMRRLIEDGWAACEHLVIANSRLVISIAKRYTNRGLPFQDLIQEGNIGLMRAIKKFDYRRGFKLSTYAYWWIRQAITRAVADQARTIRTPVHMHDQILKVFRARHQLTQRLGRDPEMEELAEVLGFSSSRVESIIQAARTPLSLETPTNYEGDLLLGDFIEDEDTPAPDDIATYNLLREDLDEMFKSLPPREVRILKLRYGLLDGQTRTLGEVGRKIGVSRERVRQIEAQALSRLRTPNILRTLKAYLGAG